MDFMAIMRTRNFCRRLAKLENQVEKLASVLKTQHNVKQTTGQGEAIFSWDKRLTDSFPDDARKFEKDMHGGFNEDPETRHSVY